MKINEKLLQPKVLYNNSTGSDSTITLNDSSANYEYLEIYFRTNDSNVYQSSIRVFSPNGKYVPLIFYLVAGNGTSIYAKMKNVFINGNTISNYGSRYCEMSITSSVSVKNNNFIYITRVVGYK